MVLSIGVSKGSRIRVGTHVVEVQSAHGRYLVISIDGGPPIHITEKESQILPNVRVFAGLGAKGNCNRLAFIAPKIIPINRIPAQIEGASTAANVALLAPVPLEHLVDGFDKARREGKVAFGGMKWELFRELDSLRNGQAVDVFIYASHAPGDLDLKISWWGRYIRHQPSIAGAHPDGMRFRPDSTQKYQSDNAGHWAVFWKLDELKEIDCEQRMDITDLISFRTGKHYPASPPEGPMLIEHP